ncbi:hypothetical protein CLAIMM_07139 [Cladophialophora immunda]|nr:hypothetical protein CLAIMM_07139 [Cladophialophora immunda]
MALVPRLPVASAALPAVAAPLPLTSLPTEVRLQIYKEVFSKIELQYDVCEKVEGTVGQNGRTQWVARILCHTRFSPRQPLAILSTNKQIMLEAQSFAISCPIFAQANYSGIVRSPIRLPLPIHVRGQVRSLATTGTPQAQPWTLPLDARQLQANEYPNLRCIELWHRTEMLYVANNFIQPLLRAGMPEFMLPRHSMVDFEQGRLGALEPMIRLNDATVKFRICLVNHQGSFVRNGDEDRLEATVVWNRQGMRVMGLTPVKSKNTAARN